MARNTLPHALPPGPRIPAAIQTALFFLRPFQLVDACRRRYGDIFQLRLRGLGELLPVIYIADIDAIRDVFAADGVAAHAGAANAVLEPITGARSILTLDRDEHLRERKLISPALHGQALTAAQRAITDITMQELADWPTDRPFPLRPALQRITFRVIAGLLLGPEEDPQTVARLPALLEPIFSNPLALLPLLRHDLGPHSPWGRFRRAREQLDHELLRIITQRRAQPPGADLLSLLVHGTDPAKPRSDEQARDELITLLIAGHETSATALAWACERLARHPHTLRHAHTAAANNDERYLDAIINETLRIRPVVMDVARVLDQPLTLAGYDLPPGTTVMPAIYLVHTDQRHHPNADTFNPERYLHTRPDPTTWLPFGGGRRRCAGAAFAQLETRTILQTILTHRTLHTPNPKPEQAILRGITFTPRHDTTLELPLAHPA